MDDPKFELRTIENPIAFCVSISKDRRIRLPKFLVIPPPYVLLENEQAGQTWLGICAAEFLDKLTVGCDSLKVLAEFRTLRPTIPKTVCEKHGLLGVRPVWLMVTANGIEILPDTAWQAEIYEFC